MRIPVLITILAVLVAGGSLAAAQPPANNNASAGSWEEYSLEAALTELEINYNLWLEMELDGVKPEVDRLEKNLLSLVCNDIYMNQQRVSELAEVVAKARMQDNQVTSAKQQENEDAFKKALDDLNTREAVHRALTKTKAFSNKYRLLGDYINLLRRELELPRLKLANEKILDPVDSKSGSTVPNHK